LIELQHKANNKALILPTKATFGDLLSLWLKDVAAARASAASLAHYNLMVETYIRPGLGSYRVTDLANSDALQIFYTALNEKGYAPKTIQYIHYLIGAALRYGVKRRLLTHNPAADTIRPKMKRKEMKFFHADEAIRFLNTARDYSCFIVYVFALDTGMRPEEYLGLQWADVNLKTGMVHVRHKLVYEDIKHWHIATDLKSDRSHRLIPLAASTLKALLDHKREQDIRRLKLGQRYLNYDMVFCEENGRAMCPGGSVTTQFKRILKAAGLDAGIRLYDLRHSSATLLLAAGVDAKTVSERLGHADEGFTLRTYAHVIQSMRAKAAATLENSVFSQLGKQLATFEPLDVQVKSAHG
jgi:integrase